MLTRRTFVKVAGAVAWCAAFLKPYPIVSEVLDHDDDKETLFERTLYMSQDARRGVVLPPGYEKKWRGRFEHAREAYIERVNRPMNMRTLVALAAKRNR